MSPAEHAQAQCSAGQSVAVKFFFKRLPTALMTVNL